jgi:alpha(1,3/1,4) fucosyltransferase
MSLTPIHVFFNKFWPGFTEKTDIIDCTFFVQLLEKTYQAPIHVVHSPDNATVLVESIFGNTSYLNYKKWRATILYTGESDYANTQNVDKYDCVLGFEETRANFVKCPLFVIFLITNIRIMKEIENANRPIPEEIPPNFASIILSNAYHGKERLQFYNTIKKEIPVFSGGKYDNNVAFVVPGSYNSNDMVDFYRRGKFAITMENNDKPYYITEKLVNGIRSGVVPIYWGSSRVTEFFNPRRFIHLSKEPTKEEVSGIITRMKNMTNDEFIGIIREPVFIRPIEEVCDEILASVKKILT